MAPLVRPWRIILEPLSRMLKALFMVISGCGLVTSWQEGEVWQGWCVFHTLLQHDLGSADLFFMWRNANEQIESFTIYSELYQNPIFAHLRQFRDVLMIASALWMVETTLNSLTLINTAMNPVQSFKWPD